jgi:hypothetical protein
LNLKSTRRGSIRIGGEPIADLDYSSMFARLAYARLGEVAPEGDLYAIPALEGFRSGVKLAFNVFLFDGKGLRTKWPAAMGVGVGDDGARDGDDHQADDSVHSGYDGLLPAGWEDPQRLRRAILGRHPALGKAFGRRLGYDLMFTESRVLMVVLAELMERGIVALPLHDGLMVARSRMLEAREVMRESVLQVAGVGIPVMEK